MNEHVELGETERRQMAIQERETAYRELVGRQHEQILASIHALGETQRSGDASTAAAINRMSEIISSALRVPVVVAMIAASTWLFYEGKIVENTWMIFTLLGLFHMGMGESIKALFGFLFGNRNVSKANAVSLALVFGVLGYLLIMPHVPPVFAR